MSDKKEKDQGKLMYDPEDKKTRVYGPLNGGIYGFQNCCSAAIMSGFSGSCYGTVQTNMTGIKPIPYEKVTSLQGYVDHIKKHRKYGGLPAGYRLTEEMAYLVFLEKVYNKAANGVGGVNMWAGDNWATKTWFIADRVTT